jgi:hypothetical protein
MRLGCRFVYRAVDQLKLDPANARRHSKKQIRQIAESIKTFGFNVPILIDHDGKVVAGHGRLLACRLLGMTEVPTLCLDHLTAAQARAFMIADNRLTEIATWDDRLLAQQLKELSLSGLDFNIEVTGFEMGEIDLRIASLDDPIEATDDPADRVPDPPTVPPLSKVGDLWLLGPHHLLCGDARDPAAFAALMGEERAAMVFTDPPYNVPIDGHVSGLGAIHHRPFPMASGEMDRSEFTAFLSQVCRSSIQRYRLDPLHLHGLAPCRRTPDRRSRRLWRAEKPLCLGQGQWRRGKKLFLLSVFRRRLEYPALKRAVREQQSLFGATVVLIEDKASGTQLIQELITEGCHGATRYQPTGEQDHASERADRGHREGLRLNSKSGQSSD